MLAARLGTAAVLIAGLLASLFLLPPLPLMLLITAITALAAHEWGRLCGLARNAAIAYAAVVAAAIVAVAFSGASRPVAVVGAVFWLAVAPWWLWRGVAAGQRRLLALAGVAVLVPAALGLLAMTPLQVALVLTLTSLADAAAYFTGRRFGRRKLAPAISPSKTWEGVYGAVAATVLFAIACQATVPQLQASVVGSVWLPYLLAVAGLCALGILGDLFESALKRQSGAKDSGTLLPGHGGVLDRIDSATSTLPIAAVLWALIGGK